MKSVKIGDVVEVPCARDGWKPCACFPRGPWQVTGLDGDGWAKAEHTMQDRATLGFLIRDARKWLPRGRW